MRALLAIIALLFSSLAFADSSTLPHLYAPVSAEVGKWTSAAGQDWWRRLSDARDGDGKKALFADAGNGIGNAGTGLNQERAPDRRWFSGEGWNDDATGREFVWQFINLVLDRGTTLDMAHRPDSYYEKTSAWALGTHPSVGRVNSVIALSSVAHLATSWSLPSEYRPYFQWITIGLSGTAVANNFRLGLHLRFR